MTLDRPCALPMYDADPGALQDWWHGLAQALRAHGVRGVPAALEAPADLDAHWRDPRLLLSQTCGEPLVSSLAGRVQVVGAFRYAVPGCAGIDYSSALVARDDDPARAIAGFRGRTAAVNDLRSHSGHNALRALVAPLAGGAPFFAATVVSGSHRASLRLLQSGAADIAAIDCVSLAGFARIDPASMTGLRVVGHTAAAPGLPLITSGATGAADLQALRAGLRAAVADPALAGARRALFIDGFEAVPAAAWGRIDALHRQALPALAPA